MDPYGIPDKLSRRLLYSLLTLTNYFLFSNEKKNIANYIFSRQ